MNIFAQLIKSLTHREKALVSPTNLSPTSIDNVWYPALQDSFAGAWQRGVRARRDDVLAFLPVYACVTRIANDISKLPFRLVEKGSDRITREIQSAAFSPVLDKPNIYQRTQKKFIEQWMLSKLVHGNAYVLKVRDDRSVVTQLYVLDPTRVHTLVGPGPTIFYRLQADNLAPENSQDVIVPQSEIIHDRMNAIFHPLVGVPPITACYASASQGIAIQRAATKFFQNNAQPGGVLSAPGQISESTATRLKKMWEERFGGDNQGRLAVLGDGLKFEKMSINPVDAQLIEQFKVTGEQICTAFHVPAFKVGLGPIPTYQNAAVLNQIYYSDCLQTLIEDLEGGIDEGLRLPANYYIEADLDALLRMDAATLMNVLKEGVGAGIMAPNEGRLRINLPPVEGGEGPYLQQQNYSLAALSKRDARDDPFAGKTPPASLPAPSQDENAGKAKALIEFRRVAKTYREKVAA
jgi:HK97 family phage portal protein